ncbi:MAG: hypothetical protein KatS3mg105_2267 [Gemmatales bacterium]|nr:MAG: hypothetical protein KatS3mg105_2267 [Gemmatales bacterium]
MRQASWRVQGLLMAALAVLSLSTTANADEPLVEQVKQAIDRGVQYLRDQEDNRGHWELDAISARHPGGETALALLALLNCGVKPDEPIIQRGLKYLRGVEPRSTYVVGLQTMVYAAAGLEVDRERIQKNVDWLLAARLGDDSGWTYGKGRAIGYDSSNTQYALLGLHAAHEAGAKIDNQVWDSIRKFYIDKQRMNGAWGYRFTDPGTLPMTIAGLCGLYITGLDLSSRQGCGQYAETAALDQAHRWIAEHFQIDYRAARYYNLYGIERAGRLSGRRFLGEHDWYREGCEQLVRWQNKETGAWDSRGIHDQWRIVNTSFALLFLAKGRTPVLISKLVHGPGNDWNNDRYDVRNLVNYASKELFKHQPLAWQIFDPNRPTIDNRQQLLDVTSDLLQSPIVYFNGHEAPRFGDRVELLKAYIDNGGFILAEACCDRPEFDQGFRALMKQMFPDNPLKPLPKEHPLWTAHADLSQLAGRFPLEGIQQGCRTVVVYSPKDLSCLWETNDTAGTRSPDALVAFRLGLNIIAYATGMELPKPRLTKMDVVRDTETEKKVPRGYLQVAQLRHEGDWQPAPRAMRNLMVYLRDGPRLDVVLRTEAIRPGHPDLANFKFLYMHGRKSFAFDDNEIKNLRADLMTGGLLLADACCGQKAFDISFRAFAKKLFPDKNLQRIPLDDRLFSQELNGTAIKTVRCRVLENGRPSKEFKTVPPFLEGIKYKNRWVVIYSKYDLGCALEKHQSSDCLGHDYQSALRLGAAAVLYAMIR